MNDLQIYKYNNIDLRTIEKDGGLWWVLKDVCKTLDIAQPARVAERLDDDEKGMNQIHTLGGNQNMLCVNESGLYNVILRSDKPEAKNFKRWVTHEVLPSIRKHGAYMTEKTLEEAILNPDYLVKIVTALKEETDKRKAIEAKSQAQEQIIAELKPKADYTDRILQNKGLVTITQIAKDYGMSGYKMNKLLYELGVQYKSGGGQWLLYSRHQAKGYTHSHTVDITRSDGTHDIKMETKWTQKGRLFLYEKLKKSGYLPVIEQ